MNEGKNAVVSSMKVSRCCINLCSRATEGIGDAMLPGVLIQPSDDTLLLLFLFFVYLFGALLLNSIMDPSAFICS